jgi:hypothetical protein
MGVGIGREHSAVVYFLANATGWSTPNSLRRLAYFAYIERPMFGLGPAVSASTDHPLVAPILLRVTAARLDFLTTLYEQLGLDAPEARRRAHYFEHAMRVLTFDTAGTP